MGSDGRTNVPMAHIGPAMTTRTPANRLSDFMGATISPVVDERGHHVPLRCRDAVARSDDSNADSVTRCCPACGIDVENQVTASGYCKACGHDLVGTAPPPRWKRGNVDLRVVARRQRHVIWAALAVFGMNLVSAAPPFLGYGVGSGVARPWLYILAASAWLLPVVMIATSVAAAVVVVRLAAALRMHPAMIVIHAILALAPCINVLVLISVSSQATTMLRREGLRVSLLGVSEEDLARVLEPSRCRNCGYILARGVPQLKCPECGAPVERFAT